MKASKGSLTALKPGKFVKLDKVNPSGSLEARRLLNGAVVFYWRYTFGGATTRVNLGRYDPAAPPKGLRPTTTGYSVAAAKRAAESLATQHHDNLSLGGYAAVAERRRAAEDSAAVRLAATQSLTLGVLLSDYCDHQKQLGRSSYRDARSIFSLHVTGAWPDIADAPANALTSEQVADMMRLLHEAGKGRTANKLRAYLRAAYQMAKSARSNAAIPVRFKAYEILLNPADEALPDASKNKADKNPLLADELRQYWAIIERISGTRGAMLRLHVLTGGQRIEQLVNLLVENVTPESMKLLDKKGRPGQPARPHVLPLIPPAIQAMTELHIEGKFAFSTDGGKTHIAATTLSKWAIEAASATITNFKAKRIRSGIETLLSRLGVSRETRGHLQSHGIAGVQARHYDANDFLDDKRRALKKLYAELCKS